MNCILVRDEQRDEQRDEHRDEQRDEQRDEHVSDFSENWLSCSSR